MSPFKCSWATELNHKKKKKARRHYKLLGSDGYVYYLDYGDDIMGVHRCSNSNDIH